MIFETQNGNFLRIMRLKRNYLIIFKKSVYVGFYKKKLQDKACQLEAGVWEEYSKNILRLKFWGF